MPGWFPHSKALNKYLSTEHFATWWSRVCCCLIPQTILHKAQDELQCSFMSKMWPALYIHSDETNPLLTISSNLQYRLPWAQPSALPLYRLATHSLLATILKCTQMHQSWWKKQMRSTQTHQSKTAHCRESLTAAVALKFTYQVER